MWEFAKDRYVTFDNNLKKWDWNETTCANIMNRKEWWGYMPGLSIENGKDYSKFFENVPAKNKDAVIEAIHFVHKFCSREGEKSTLDIPNDWKDAYDLRAWVAFPEKHLFKRENLG